MNDLFLKIINMSISASWLVLAVLLLRFVLKKAPKWVNVLLWGIVAVRLAFPFSIESALSLIPSAETVPMDIEMAVQPTINSGVPVINSILEFGQFKDGVFVDAETASAQQHSYTFFIEEAGLYCFYVEYYSADASFFTDCTVTIE